MKWVTRTSQVQKDAFCTLFAAGTIKHNVHKMKSQNPDKLLLLPEAHCQMRSWVDRFFRDLQSFRYTLIDTGNQFSHSSSLVSISTQAEIFHQYDLSMVICQKWQSETFTEEVEITSGLELWKMFLKDF